jgi:hypothetical protein
VGPASRPKASRRRATRGASSDRRRFWRRRGSSEGPVRGGRASWFRIGSFAAKRRRFSRWCRRMRRCAGGFARSSLSARWCVGTYPWLAAHARGSPRTPVARRARPWPAAHASGSPRTRLAHGGQSSLGSPCRVNQPNDDGRVASRSDHDP